MDRYLSVYLLTLNLKIYNYKRIDMKKLIALLICTILLSFAVSCDGDGATSSPSVSSGSDTSASAASSDDTSAEASADTSVGETTPVMTVADVENVNDIPVIYAQKYAALDSFEAVTEGATVANMIISVTQTISARLIKKGDEGYLHNESHSSFVNIAHTAYFKGGSVRYKEKDDTTYTNASLSEYAGVYGVYPFAECIEGYTVGAGAVKNTELLSFGKTYVYKIELDMEASTSAIKVQMKKSGSLSELPSFTSLVLTLEIKPDFTPVKVNVKAEYNAKMAIFNAACKQDITITYSKVNESVELPTD